MLDKANLLHSLVKPTMVEAQAQCCLQTAYDRLQEWPSLVPHCLTVGSGRENPHNGTYISYAVAQLLHNMSWVL
jgi:hypothetical protein